MRLKAWAEWRCGSHQSARNLLEKHFSRVDSLLERGRWADMLATILRWDSTEDWFSAVAMYQQAVSFKELEQDWLGVAMSLQNIAFTYIEWLDLGHGRYYLNRLLDRTSTHNYEGVAVSKCLCHLALVWVEFMRGSQCDLLAARRHLQYAGELMAGSKSTIPHELRRASKALSFALKIARGRRLSLTSRIERAFWARLILAQVRAFRGEDVTALRDYVLSRDTEPLLPPHRLQPLLNFALLHFENPPNQSRSLEWFREASAFWPLGNWLTKEVSNGIEAIQFLEGISHLYASVLAGAAEDESWTTQRTLGENGRYISSWAETHSNHPLAPEALIVGSSLRQASGPRNAIVHSTPGQSIVGAERRLVQAARQLSFEIANLRGAEWVTKAPPVLRVAGLSVNMKQAFSADSDGRLAFSVGGKVFLTESDDQRQAAQSTDEEDFKTRNSQ